MPDFRSVLLRPLAGVLATACLAFGVRAAGVGQLPPAAPSYDFDKDIKPILEANCVRCHGETRQKSDFRLDTRAGLLRGGEENEKVIVEGHSDESPLIRLVAGLVEDIPMPPKKEGVTLTAGQIGLLRAWIDAGAKYPAGVALVNTNTSAESAEAAETEKIAAAVLERGRNHWAFKPPARPPLPRVKDTAWAKTPIDAFVLARLEKEGLAPAPEADKATLLRRVSLDLTGLPPTLQELDAFLADKAPDAYAKQVERLLKSPHYGERWARHWLDAARYADSDGFEKDKPRFAWAYRDWVIDAINKDLPYDKFIIEQIAGDQLPNAAQDQVVATGYLRNSMINEEGGVDPEQFRMEAMFDRMDAIGKGVLGLTIQCAQCHNHKFDPILQEDYYKLFAFLNNDHEGSKPVYSPGDLMKLAEQRRQIGELEENLRHTTPDWASRMARWEEAAKAGEPEWTVVQPTVEDISTGGQRYLPQADGSFLAQGYAPTKHEVKMTAKVDATSITAFRLELLTDPNLPLGGPGRSFKGTNALTEFRVDAAAAGRRGQARAREVRESQRRFRRRHRFAARAELRRQVRQEARHRACRFRDRRQRRDRMGHRCRARSPQRPAQGRLHARDTDRLREGRTAGLPAETEPRRLEQRRPDDQQPRPLPPRIHGGDGPGRRPAAEGRARDPVDPPRETLARPDQHRLQLLAHDRPGIHRRPTRRSRPSPGSTRSRRRRRWSSKPAARCATRACSSAATG